MAAVQAKTYRSSLKAMVSSPVCDEEENSDLDSSCSTLSVDESENSPPQSQVTPGMLRDVLLRAWWPWIKEKMSKIRDVSSRQNSFAF